VISRRNTRELMAWALVAVLSLIALALVVFHYRETPAELQPVRFEVALPDNISLGEFGFPVMSPNGRYLVYSGAESTGKNHLWLHSLDSLTTQALVAADNAYNPFWSPDSRFVGFFSGGKLKKIDISGGLAETICDIGGDFAPGGSWNRDGIILFAHHVGGVYSVPAAGGDSKRVLELDQARRETAHLWPHFLPDGRHFLYLSRSTEAGNSGINVASLDSRETRRLFSAESNVSYAPPGS
jgi:eukaryotic-like serine/threonine-protein kinase